jgi:hypothetical protein
MLGPMRTFLPVRLNNCITDRRVEQSVTRTLTCEQTGCSYKRMNADDASMMTDNTHNHATHDDMNGGAYGKYE